jgi:hypothetical protein
MENITHVTALATCTRMGFTEGQKYEIIYNPIENGVSKLEEHYFIWVYNNGKDSVNARLERFEEAEIIQSAVDKVRANS